MKDFLIVVQVRPHCKTGTKSAAGAIAEGRPQLYWLLERIARQYTQDSILVEGSRNEWGGPIGTAATDAGVACYFTDVDPLERLLTVSESLSDDGFLFLSGRWQLRY